MTKVIVLSVCKKSSEGIEWIAFSSFNIQLAKVLVTVLKKKYLLSRKDLQLDWKPLFDLYFHYEDSSGAMRSMVKGIVGLKQQVTSSILLSS